MGRVSLVCDKMAISVGIVNGVRSPSAGLRARDCCQILVIPQEIMSSVYFYFTF